MFDKKPAPTMEELFLQNAATKSEAKRVMKLALNACDSDCFVHTSLSDFANVRGLGKSALLLIAKVQIEMLKKK